eukprot:751051-Hanusia_phi.AAC.2
MESKKGERGKRGRRCMRREQQGERAEERASESSAGQPGNEQVLKVTPLFCFFSLLRSNLGLRCPASMHRLSMDAPASKNLSSMAVGHNSGWTHYAGSLD